MDFPLFVLKYSIHDKSPIFFHPDFEAKIAMIDFLWFPVAYWLDLADLSPDMADLSCRDGGAELRLLKVQKKN